jgi:type III secretory pathway component EscR
MLIQREFNVKYRKIVKKTLNVHHCTKEITQMPKYKPFLRNTDSKANNSKILNRVFSSKLRKIIRKKSIKILCPAYRLNKRKKDTKTC